MDNYFQNIFPKISRSQEDNQISIFGCPHSFFGRRGHEDTQILLPWLGMTLYLDRSQSTMIYPLDYPVDRSCLCHDVKIYRIIVTLINN